MPTNIEARERNLWWMGTMLLCSTLLMFSAADCSSAASARTEAASVAAVP